VAVTAAEAGEAVVVIAVEEMEAVLMMAAEEMEAEARAEAVVDEAVTAVEATEAVVVMAAKEIEAEARAEAVMVVAAMAEEATAERVKVVEKAVAKEAVVMMAAETVAAREAEASAAVIWEVGNQEGHSNGHSPLQRGSSPYSVCAMMQRRAALRCTPVGTVLSRKTSRALQSYQPTRRELSPSAQKPHTVHVNSKEMFAHIVQRPRRSTKLLASQHKAVHHAGQQWLP